MRQQTARAISSLAPWASVDLERLTERSTEKVRAAEVLNFAAALARKRALENVPLQEAIEKFSEIIRDDPNNALAFFNRGRCYQEEAQQLDAAIADYSQAIILNPKYAEAYNNRGVAHLSKANAYRAIADLELAIAYAKHANFYNNMGNAYFILLDFSNALPNYSEAIKLDPSFVSAYCNRGGTYHLQGQLGLAISDFDKAVELDPKFSGAWCGRGGAAADQENYGQAIADLTKAIQLDPNNHVAYGNRGLVYARTRKTELAIKDCTEAIRLDPNYAAYFVNRSMAHDISGERELAIDDAKRAIELDSSAPEKSGNPYLFLARGFAHTTRNEYDAAIADYTKALTLWPGFVEALYNRCLMWLIKDERVHALADLVAALQLNPNLANSLDSDVIHDFSGMAAEFYDSIREQPQVFGETKELVANGLNNNQIMAALKRRKVSTHLLALIQAELTKKRPRRREVEQTKPPLPVLTEKQIAAIARRAKQRPWSKRPTHRMSAFEWVRDNFGEWIPGLLQSHLKVDPQLYSAFTARVSREGLPDWLDVPSENEARLRNLEDPVERERLKTVREWERIRSRQRRASNKP
jgi:tetratricopeptide (TPR) repeat protein